MAAAKRSTVKAQEKKKSTYGLRNTLALKTRSSKRILERSCRANQKKTIREADADSLSGTSSVRLTSSKVGSSKSRKASQKKKTRELDGSLKGTRKTRTVKSKSSKKGSRKASKKTSQKKKKLKEFDGSRNTRAVKDVKGNKSTKLDKKPTIIDVYLDHMKQFWMVMTWKGTNKLTHLRISQVNEEWPELVIAFYEKRRQTPFGHLLWETGPHRKFRRLHVEKIECVVKRYGELFYGVKWIDSEETSFVHFKDAVKLWPQQIINLYEDENHVKLQVNLESEIVEEIDSMRLKEGFEPQEIKKVGLSPQREKVYQIRWKDSTETVVRAAEANRKYPEMVIAFYQPYLSFPDEQKNQM